MSTNQQKPEAPKKKSKGFIIVLAILILGGGTFGLTTYIHGQHHEETDDAQIDANISPVIPRVAGYVKEVRVKDNQYVKKGDTLIILDDRDLAIRVQQAEAALSTAQSNLGAAEATTNASRANIASTEAGVSTIDAQIATAKVNLWRATQDYQRYANLIKDHSITQQQFEQAEAAKQTAENQLNVLEQQKNQVSKQTSAVASQSNATSSQISVAGSVIKQKEVDVADAKLDLSYAVITAQESGLISKVNVQEGQFLQSGQSLFNIVLSNDVWVVANFKETQFGKIQVGQKVIVHVDAYPGHDFEGKVTSFSPATGSRFALLPPDNSSGNFVKVVSRLPVKIEFDKSSDSLVNQLRPGMNVAADVHLD
ncbi:HlyD family secretion protein [Ferruginibacter albus]|uniref:HlyD family secretion protein n=1 Tax=Ferruginibacter albus TaxID=2875540 RepID=UPI001CC39816|nr:HlyD family secretion protein [Ferruginibacter albus]UAY52099.1 HlyD family secretion protein [Ferruginibacter albus]